MKAANPIIRDVSKLLKTLRRSDCKTLEKAHLVLQSFSDAWLVDGEIKNLDGADDCTLSDTDLAVALIPVLEIYLENRQ